MSDQLKADINWLLSHWFTVFLMVNAIHFSYKYW